MQTTRREFLEQTGAAALALSALGSGAQSAAAQSSTSRGGTSSTPTLIAVYLRGGADMLGTVVPYGDPNYTRVHPTLAVPGPDATAEERALRLDDTFGFNPNLRPLHALYQRGLCVPVVCAGSPHPTRSHFDAQDFMERGAPGLKLITTGWLNRYLQATRTARDANLRAVSLQSLLPRSLRGAYPVLAKPDEKAELAMRMYYQLYQRGGSRTTTTSTATGETGTSAQQTRQAIEQLGARTIEQLWDLTNTLERAPAPTANYPTSGFGRQMRDLAKLIKAQRGLEITALDYGGWDHHIDEGPVGGQLGRKLADVGNTLGAFMEDLGPQRAQKVMVVVMTEFGRTVRENANRGTDHGHGSFMLLVGGPLNGRRVYGRWTGLEQRQLNEGRDLPVHTDFRVVFAEVLKGLFGFDGFQRGMFPEYRPPTEPLGLTRTA